MKVQNQVVVTFSGGEAKTTFDDQTIRIGRSEGGYDQPCPVELIAAALGS